ncbi:MAG TPA: adenylate/guanylate cyclase domain-containing protein, partial [Acidimicrobiia bacterium]|nr:adenylate/guanylate cyclase domain-containing protein [Acidimicrobiia bacterium]
MDGLPTGIVTFLFTDIEGSTRLLQKVGDGYRFILEEHADIVRSAVAAQGGTVVSTEGDSFFAVFASPAAAIGAAADVQRKLTAHHFPASAEVRVRVGIHTGEGTLGGDNYVGLDVHRAARIAAAGHGGQVVLSNPTAVLAGDHLPEGVSLRPLGEHRLKDLAHPETLFQLVIDGLRSDFPPVRTLDAIPNNLPLQLTTFVGRSELKAIVDLLDEARLVTLTGPGGTGKTRLAIQAAAEMTGRFVDGVWFVPLAALTDPELIPSAVGTALGMQPSAEDPDLRLAEYLRTRETLLVLDNFEQILDAAPRVATWLREAPRLRILVTSRGPLHLSGEREFPVPPLTLPAADDLPVPETLMHFESVALFVDRATAARPDFRLDSRNAARVVEIVSKLEGLPLAIELAAARVRLLSLEAICERLSSRLGLLTGGARDLPERQRTLRGTIEWSYDLLDERHRRLFARLAVFVGGFALEQAEEVCGPGLDLDVLVGLETLADQSLLRPVAESPQSRFVMLATIREYALERLALDAEAPEIHGRHARAYLALAEEAAPEYTRRHTRRWLDRTENDHDNFRAAITWAIEAGEAETAQRLCGALWRFWQMRGYLKEGRERAEAAIRVPGGSDRSLLAAHEAAGGLAYWQAEMDAALAHYESALELARRTADPALVAGAIYNLAAPLAFQHGVAQALETLEEALSLAEQVGDAELIGRIHWGKGTVHYLTEQPVMEQPEEALAEYMLAAE